MIGIYKITSPTGKIYIGQSINIEKRKTTYKYKNCKGQIKLFNSIQKYGWNNHKFEILEICEVSELNNKERYYQDLYCSVGINGLNLILTKSKDKSGCFNKEIKNKISKNKRINNAKKRGDFDPKKDYSFISKKNTKKLIFVFPLTGEVFKSGKKLYEKHSDYFYSYSSLMYNYRKNGYKVILGTLNKC